MVSKEQKRRSFIMSPDGSPLIPINSTFGPAASISFDEYNNNIIANSSSARRYSMSGTKVTSTPSSTVSNSHTRSPQLHHGFDLLKHSDQSKITSMVKLLLIGDAGVGKSALIVRYCHGLFEENSSKTTIGVDLKVKEVNIDGRYLKAVLWDTAGQERYRNVIPTLYKGTNGVLLTYDITDRDSFDALKHWIKECYDNCDLSKTIFYIVGNKMDQESERAVERDDIRELLKFVKSNYTNFKINAVFEVSAKHSVLVTGLFDSVLRDLVENRCYFDERTLRNKKSIDLSTAKQDHSSNCCSY